MYQFPFICAFFDSLILYVCLFVVCLFMCMCCVFVFSLWLMTRREEHQECILFFIAFVNNYLLFFNIFFLIAPSPIVVEVGLGLVRSSEWGTAHPSE